MKEFTVTVTVRTHLSEVEVHEKFTATALDVSEDKTYSLDLDITDEDDIEPEDDEEC